MIDSLDDARRVFEVAKAKAPTNASLTSYLPYLRAAIPFFRLLADTPELGAAVEATTNRIDCEDAFRSQMGRSFSWEFDQLTYEAALALESNAKHP